MLNLRLVRHSLKRTNEDNNVNTSMGKVSYHALKALVELMQLWATKVFWVGSRQLCVHNDSEVASILDLI